MVWRSVRGGINFLFIVTSRLGPLFTLNLVYRNGGGRASLNSFERPRLVIKVALSPPILQKLSNLVENTERHRRNTKPFLCPFVSRVKVDYYRLQRVPCTRARAAHKEPNRRVKQITTRQRKRFSLLFFFFSLPPPSHPKLKMPLDKVRRVRLRAAGDSSLPRALALAFEDGLFG